MSITSFILFIHWIPVFAVTLLSFVLGYVWHSPYLFGKVWKQETDYDKVQKQISVPLIFGATAIFNFVAIASLSAVVSGLGAFNGFVGGLTVALVWIVPVMASTYLFANRSLKLLMVDAGMYVVLFSVAGLILGVW